MYIYPNYILGEYSTYWRISFLWADHEHEAGRIHRSLS